MTHDILNLFGLSQCVPRNNSMYSDVVVSVLIFAFGIRSPLGYAKKLRAVPAWLKRQAYAEYGITRYKTGDYEVDYLISAIVGRIEFHS